MKTLRESRCIDLLCFYTSALEGGEGSASRPGRFLPPGKTRYPLYRRLGGPQERPGTHCTGGWVGPRKDPVPIVQEVGWAPGKTRYPLYRRLGRPQKRPGTHCTGGWMGPRAGLDGCEKSPLPPRDSINGSPSPV